MGFLGRVIRLRSGTFGFTFTVLMGCPSQPLPDQEDGENTENQGFLRTACPRGNHRASLPRRDLCLGHHFAMVAMGLSPEV